MKSLAKNEKTMTVKEVSEVLGVSTDLIKKRVRELFPNKMENGKTTFLNETEITAIKKRIEQNAHLVTYDDRHRLAEMPKTNLEKQLLIRQAMQLQNEMIAELEAENKQLKQENAEIKPKAELAEALTSSKQAISMAEAEKVLGLPFGRNTAFRKLRQAKILNKDNVPYQEYCNRGYFRVKETKWKTKSGEVKITITTEVYQKGMNFLRNLFIKYQIIPA